MPGPWWAFLVPAAVEIVKEVIGLFKDKAKSAGRAVKQRAVKKQQEARAPK